MKNYWKEHFEKLDACKTQQEANALLDEEFFLQEKKALRRT